MKITKEMDLIYKRYYRDVYGFCIRLCEGHPEMAGICITKAVREQSNIPILFLTACDDEVHTVLALEQGADDYISKPFRIRELLARMKAILRRSGVAKIDQQTKRITWFVRNLLTLSQLEADMLELKKEEQSLKDILDSIMETFEVLAEVKDIQLICNVPQEIMITCDRQWTTEALSNIVKNCIEHTPEGGNVLICAIQHNIATEITITDTGVGIAQFLFLNIP